MGPPEPLAYDARCILRDVGVIPQWSLWRECLERARQAELDAHRLAHLYVLSLAFALDPTRTS